MKKGCFGYLTKHSPYHDIFDGGRVPLRAPIAQAGTGEGTDETAFYLVDVERIETDQLHEVARRMTNGDPELFDQAMHYFLDLGYIPVRASQITSTTIDLRMVI